MAYDSTSVIDFYEFNTTDGNGAQWAYLQSTTGLTAIASLSGTDLGTGFAYTFTPSTSGQWRILASEFSGTPAPCNPRWA